MRVLVDDHSPTMSVGEEWLIALSGVGTPFIECMGVFAVKVENGEAVGRLLLQQIKARRE